MAVKVSENIAYPICLEQFKALTSLPCLHTFCLKCLNSHIIEKVTKAGDVGTFSCPVCRQEIRSPEPGVQSSEWAKSFPLNNFIATLLPDPQSKVQLNCNSCAYEFTTNQTIGFCIVCIEHLCDECIKFHCKTKCQSLVSALQNSKRLLDTVCEHGSQTQVINILLKTEEQMEHYTKTMDQYKTENTETEVKLELDSHIKTVGEMKWKDCITLRHTLTEHLHSTRHIDKNELVLVLRISEFSHSGSFSSLYLSGDRILLAYWEREKCCMYSPNFDKISERISSSSPSPLCKPGERSEFAVTLPCERKIKFFTSDTYMKPTRFIQTRIACCGVAIANNGDPFVTYLSNQYLYAAHLSDMGVEKNSIKLDSVDRMNYRAIIAIDPANTRVYISCYNTKTLYI
ncbi:hypothetical protein CHS0354_027057 [Potamilus streckersoni]|uniref:RING-type domain-containing protein n=1 Tax=Potamilus streckersoni TaxID=2493646 RepID=A0AAE0VFU5_9BIVA|nr:hypothetical protein CHS0354_027057 [Potamilus streckersoni]